MAWWEWLVLALLAPSAIIIVLFTLLVTVSVIHSRLTSRGTDGGSEDDPSNVRLLPRKLPDPPKRPTRSKGSKGKDEPEIPRNTQSDPVIDLSSDPARDRDRNRPMEFPVELPPRLPDGHRRHQLVAHWHVVRDGLLVMLGLGCVLMVYIAMSGPH